MIYYQKIKLNYNNYNLTKHLITISKKNHYFYEFNYIFIKFN